MQEFDIMEGIIAAIIGAAGGIIAVLLSELLLGKRIIDILKTHVSDSSRKHKELSDEHNRLSNEHNRLSKEHNSLSKEHGNILSELKSYIMEKTTAINNILIEEKTKHEFRYNSLNDHQKIISDSIKNLENFSREFERVVFENKQLLNEIDRLKIERGDMELQMQEFKSRIKSYDRSDEWER